ncbi:MAG: glycosyltransferase family 9 protein [Cytophagaceae bacterium]|nr:glycosyltransferase family 9 protein [Cytophagaceae bacterium]
MSKVIRRLVLSRTDSIGDVVVSLTTAAYLKKLYPDLFLYFIGRSYTQAIIEACPYVDQFLDRDTIVTNKGLPPTVQADAIVYLFPDKTLATCIGRSVPIRVGTAHRLFHWWTCTRRVFFNRSRSPLHEAQLNFYLLQSLFGMEIPSLDQLKQFTLLQAVPAPSGAGIPFPDTKIKIILHPKSKGSAREWPIEQYKAVCSLLSPEKYQIYISGTAAEGQLILETCSELFSFPHVINITGKLSLSEFIQTIQRCDVLVACSTGPLHIAAALQKKAIGIYPPIRPMHPGRWAPLGSLSEVAVLDKDCSDCRTTGPCACIASITPSYIVNRIVAYEPTR